VGGQRHSPATLPPGERPGTHYIGGWVGPRGSLDGCGKSWPHWNSIPRPSSPSRYTDRAIPAWCCGRLWLEYGTYSIQYST